MNQEITFLSDGDDTLRALQLEISPKATHLLDWFHLTMKCTVLGQYGNGLVQCEAVLGEQIQDQIGRLKWSLWHGQVDKALGKIDDLERSIEPFSETYARFPKLVKALSQLHTYIVNNRHLIPNYGEAISQRRADRDRICRIDGERSGEQTILQKTTDAMVQRRGALVVADARANAERGISRYLQALVSGHGP